MIYVLTLLLSLMTFSALAEEAEQAPEVAIKAELPVIKTPSSYTIMAIVNDDVISSLDVAERMQLIITTSGRSDTPQTRSRLAPQVIKSLIDERLKLQAAKQHNIMVGLDDIKAAIARIEGSQGKPEGSLEKLIEENRLSVLSFHNQIKGEVAWNKILARKIKRDVKISEDEVRRSQKRIAAGKNVEEWQIATLALPLEEGGDMTKLQNVATQMRDELMAGGDVPAIAEKYRKEAPVKIAPATWVQRDLLHPGLRTALEGIEKGGVSPPAITPMGVQLVRLLDRRMTKKIPNNNAEVALKQIILRMHQNTSDFEIDVMMDVARAIAKNPGSCLYKGVAGMKDHLEELDIEVNYIRTTLASMSPDLRPMVEPLSVTDITEPFAAPDGIHLLMLCERINMPPPLPDPDEVRQVLFQEKLELEAEKYLRTLRREAFIDVRV